MENSHLPLVVVLALAMGLAAVILALSYVLGPKRPNAGKAEPFECGNLAPEPAPSRLHVQYYLVALLFLAFDVEAVFVYPWAVLFGDAVRAESANVAPLVLEMGGFVAMLLVGLAYVYKKGALDWQRGST